MSDSINGAHTVFVDPTCNVRKSGEMKHTTHYIYIYILYASENHLTCTHGVTSCGSKEVSVLGEDLQ